MKLISAHRCVHILGTYKYFEVILEKFGGYCVHQFVEN